jgi:hypothetical protein
MLSFGDTEDSESTRLHRASRPSVFTVSSSVPEATYEAKRHQSTTLSVGGTDDGSMRPRDTILTPTSSQGIPATVDDLLRTSFVTTTSSTSHMSNIIGDFPAPPVAALPVRATSQSSDSMAGGHHDTKL